MTKIDHIEYKQAEISLIPDNWKMVRLGEVCETTQNRDPRMTPDLPFRYVDISSVYNRTKQIIEARTILGKDAPSRARQVIKTNDIIIATTRPNLNAVAIVSEELHNEICSTGFCVLRPTELIAPLFLFAFVQTQYFVETLSNQVRGMLYPAVTDNQVRNIYLPLPPLSDQHRIAVKIQEIMQEIYNLKSAISNQSETAKALPSAYLREVFESEDAKKWERRKLGEVAKYINGRAFKPEEWKQTGIPIIRIQNLNDPNASFNYFDGDVEEKYKVKNGDLLISWSASLGVYFWRRGDAVLNQHIFKVEEYPDLVFKDFFYFVVNHAMATIKEQIHGATMKHITKPEFEKIYVPIPPLKDQRRVASCLQEKISQVENLQSKILNQQSAIEVLPQAILRKAFRGEL